MRHFYLIFSVLLCFFASCSPKIITQTRTEYRDSVVTVVRERIVRDTVGIEIPVEVEKIVTRDTLSRLENTYARSVAEVAGGFLHHSLESRPQVIYVPVEVPVADTTTTHTSSAIDEKTETKIQYVEKQLSWWQRTQIYGFRVAVLLALLWILWRYLGRKTKIGLWILQFFKK